MTGIIGGHRTDSELTPLVENLHHEPWYETSRSESETAGFALVDHGPRDPQSNTLWENDRYQAVVYGVISNLDELSLTMGDIVPGVFDRPGDALSELEGPFLFACHDRDTGEFRVATDKLGSRECYYTHQHDFQFSSQVSALLPAVPDPTVDRDAIADLLLFGAAVADHTLVEEIRSVPPATVLTYDDGDVSTNRYWWPDDLPYTDADSTRYVRDWIDEYQHSIGNLVNTVEGDFGIWLSGGIDSRAAAIALQNENQPFTTFTYETRSQSDQSVARTVANALGVRNYQVNSGPPEKLRSGIEKAIEINDGLQAWSAIVALPFMMHELSEFADVVMEGSRFLGEDVWAHSIRNRESPTEMILHKKGKLPAERVERLVGVSDPASSLRDDVRNATDHALPYRLQILDAMRRFYAYTHMRSNAVQRSQAGTRVVSDGSVVDVALNVPDGLRMQTIPGTNGKLPYGVPKIKLEVMRELDNEATRVPYRRSMVDPDRPLWQHVAGFFARETGEKLLRSPHRPYLDAYREQRVVRRFLNDLLDDAKRRAFFDANEITRLQNQVLSGDSSDITPVAAITGVEHWIQTYLDDGSNR